MISGWFFLILQILLAPPSRESAALITAVTDEVQIIRVSSAPVYAQVLDLLYPGDTLRSGPKGRVTLIYANGQIVNLGPATELVIAEVSEPSRGTGIDETSSPLENAGRVFAFIAESEKMTVNLTVRGPEDSLVLKVYEPGYTFLVDRKPRMVWGQYSSAQTYQVKIQRQGITLVNIITVDTMVSYPDDREPLTPGKYLLRVMACAAGGETLAFTDRIFSVMADEAVDSLNAVLNSIRQQSPDSFTTHLLSAKLYEEKKLRLSAIAEYRAILEKQPALPFALRALSNLYRELGLPVIGNRYLDQYEKLTGKP